MLDPTDETPCCDEWAAATGDKATGHEQQIVWADRTQVWVFTSTDAPVRYCPFCGTAKPLGACPVEDQ